MSIVLGCPWSPRGEFKRFKRHFSTISELYDEIAIAVIGELDEEIVEFFQANDIRYEFFTDWSGRHKVLRMALESGHDYLHYVDMDRLVRWAELRPEELKAIAHRVQTVDTLIIGRTAEAYATHSRTLIETEKIANTVFSHWFGRDMDFAAGSRGFSRQAVQLILDNTIEFNSLAMDAGWAVLIKRAGLSWDYVEVDGLDWETADRYKDQAATANEQRELAEKVDSKWENWQMRVHVAQQIVEYGLLAMNQEIKQEVG